MSREQATSAYNLWVANTSLSAVAHRRTQPGAGYWCLPVTDNSLNHPIPSVVVSVRRNFHTMASLTNHFKQSALVLEELSHSNYPI